jgi:PBP1b-binding outer membrane lipoprotein LpoB
MSRYHSPLAIALFISGCAVISLFATAMLKDNTNKNISGD